MNTGALQFGPDTIAVAGQRNTVPTSYAYAPTSYGVQTTGVPQVSPQQPPFIGQGNGGGASLGVEGVGGYGTAGNNAVMTATAARNPHSLKVSPVWWAVIFLIVGLLMLNGVSWRKTTLESAEEHATLGTVSEGAAERADA